MSLKNPWKTLSTKIIYKNPWIKLREDQVICPDGSRGTYSVVETKIAAGVIALNENNEIYLVGQYRYPTQMYSWEIIEGGVEHDEDSLAGAKRELAEEAGLLAGQWDKLGADIQLSNCFSNEIARFYLARNLSATIKKPDKTEVLEIKKVSYDHALEMIKLGEITDGMSVLGILLLDKFFKNNL